MSSPGLGTTGALESLDCDGPEEAESESDDEEEFEEEEELDDEEEDDSLPAGLNDLLREGARRCCDALRSFFLLRFSLRLRLRLRLRSRRRLLSAL